MKLWRYRIVENIRCYLTYILSYLILSSLIRALECCFHFKDWAIETWNGSIVKRLSCKHETITFIISAAYMHQEWSLELCCLELSQESWVYCCQMCATPSKYLCVNVTTNKGCEQPWSTIIWMCPNTTVTEWKPWRSISMTHASTTKSLHKPLVISTVTTIRGMEGKNKNNISI